MAGPKKASAAGVSRALVEAGVTKSQTHRSGQIKGWSESTAGFVARDEKAESGTRDVYRWTASGQVKSTRPVYQSTGEVVVSWTDGAWFRGESKRDVELERAKAALEAKGYVVQWVDQGIGKALSVKRPDPAVVADPARATREAAE